MSDKQPELDQATQNEDEGLLEEQFREGLSRTCPDWVLVLKHNSRPSSKAWWDPHSTLQDAILTLNDRRTNDLTWAERQRGGTRLTSVVIG